MTSHERVRPVGHPSDQPLDPAHLRPPTPRSTFQSFVERGEPANPALPLMHSCDAYALRSVLRSGALEPRECPVFGGEPLVYFYYGRPAYRVNPAVPSSKLQHNFPTALIFDHGGIGNPKRLAPFDTGAFTMYAEGGHLHGRMPIDDFLLPPDITWARRLVTVFYGTNSAYVHGNVIPGLVAGGGEFEVEAYLSLITDGAATALDDRSSTIELQVGRSVSLVGSGLRAIVLPSGMLDTAEVAALTHEHKVVAIEYDTFTGAPREYHHLVFSKVVEWLFEEGML